MYRILILFVVAMIVYVGSGMLSLFDSKTLATQSFYVGQSTKTFCVQEIDGCLYASVHERSPLASGTESVLMIGSRDQVGGDVEPTIMLAADGMRVLLGVGPAMAEYSAITETLTPVSTRGPIAVER